MFGYCDPNTWDVARLEKSVKKNSYWANVLVTKITEYKQRNSVSTFKHDIVQPDGLGSFL